MTIESAVCWDVPVTDQLLPEVFRRWFVSRGWIPRAHQLRTSGESAGRPLGAADRADRRRQDAGGVSCRVWWSLYAASIPSRSLPRLRGRVGGGGRLSKQPPPDRLRRSTSPVSGGGEREETGGGEKKRKLISTGREHPPRRRPAHALHLAAKGARGRHRAQSRNAGARDGPAVRLETRTGDTPASKRQRQRRDPPDILLTTPEQLAAAARDGGRAVSVRLAQARRARRIALAGHVEARRSVVARACAALRARAAD